MQSKGIVVNMDIYAYIEIILKLLFQIQSYFPPYYS